MKNMIKTCALTCMIFAAAILVKTVDVKPIWTDKPIATFIVFMISAAVWCVGNEAE